MSDRRRVGVVPPLEEALAELREAQAELQRAHLRVAMAAAQVASLGEHALEALANGKRTLTVAEAAAALGVGKEEVYRLTGKGELASMRFGEEDGALRIPVGAIDTLVAMRTRREAEQHLPHLREVRR